jgi:hypothetical protein
MVVLKPKFNVYSLIIRLTIPAILAFLGAEGWIIGPFLVFIYRPLSMLFTRYEISPKGILIKELWVKTNISVDKIQGINEVTIPAYKQLFNGFPASYSVIKYNRFDEAHIYLPKEVVKNALIV